jgi:MFS family permease
MKTRTDNNDPQNSEATMEPGVAPMDPTVGSGAWMLAAPRRAFRSLRHRNFRLFSFGQVISLPGAWMQTVALSWLVYRMTDSATLLGVVQFAMHIPIFLFGLLGGLAADRFPRRRLVMATQVLLMAQASVLAALVLTGRATIHHLILLAAVLGFALAFDIPARQSLLSELVPPKDLMNAIALNSSNFNLARLVGPAAAGFLVARWGEGMCFLINALTFTVVLVALTQIRTVTPRSAGDETSPLKQLGEGLVYVASTPHAKALLSLLAAASLCAYPHIVLMPVFARDILGGDASTLGTLMASGGGGALLGALTLASRRDTRGLGRTLALSCGGFGAALVAFSFSRHLVLSHLLMVAAGFGMMMHLASTNTLLQSLVPGELRGRLMSIYSTILIGFAPFGSLVTGWFADQYGAPTVLAACGGLLVLSAARFAARIPALGKAWKNL